MINLRLHFLLLAVVVVSLHLSGCTAAAVTPIALSEYQLHKRHKNLGSDVLAVGVVDRATVESNIIVRPFTNGERLRGWFDELWLMPLMPWIDTRHAVLTPLPETMFPQKVDLTIDPPETDDWEVWSGEVMSQLDEGLTDFSLPEDRRVALEKLLPAAGFGPLEERLAARTGGTALYGSGEVTVQWKFVPDFNAERFCRDLLSDSARQSEHPVPVSLEVGRDIIPVVDVREENVGADDVVVDGHVERCSIDSRRILWLLTAVGGNYLSVIGGPQTCPRLAAEMVLTARRGDGEILLRRRVTVETARRTTSLWYGYGLRDELVSDFNRQLNEAFDEFATDLARELE